jgi:hypothetical protein
VNAIADLGVHDAPICLFTMRRSGCSRCAEYAGGGALRSIGETFQATPATGTGSLAVPLGLPQGRGGGPSLALAYDSGSGNGLFGLGWSVHIPAITRKTEKRLPEYDELHETDIFQLAGAEDLVPARKIVAGAWVDDESIQSGYRVLRYRPRIEGGFARIERWTRITDGDVHWVVTSAGNVTSTFGVSPTARLADPKDPLRVFSWLLERVVDDRGNVTTYGYAQEDLANIDVTAACERHRVKGLASITNVHPKRIRWGNTVMGDDTTYVFEAVFDYGEHDQLIPTPSAAPAATWPVRLDPFSSYRAGFAESPVRGLLDLPGATGRRARCQTKILGLRTP